MHGTACKQEVNYISEAFWYSLHTHIVYKLLLDYIGEGSLNVKEEHC